MTKRAAYDSDISDEEWSYLEALLPAPKCGTSRGGRPQEFPTREIVNGLRYVLRTGCAWRIVKRTFGWLCCQRRFSKDYEFRTDTSEALIRIAIIGLMARRLAR